MLPFKMRVSTGWEKWREDWFWGKEPETIAWIEGMNADSRMWDIGANIGVYSLFAASLGHEVSAFEPSNINYEALIANKRMNDFKNLEVFKIALSNRDGVSVFNEYFEAGMSGSQIGSGGRCCQESRGDSLGFPQPDYIKIDTDGNEWDILRGCERTLVGVRALCVEVNDFKIVGWLQSRGFKEDITFTKLKRRGGLNVIFTKY